MQVKKNCYSCQEKHHMSLFDGSKKKDDHAENPNDETAPLTSGKENSAQKKPFTTTHFLVLSGYHSADN